jgi:hypothetical protein
MIFLLLCILISAGFEIYDAFAYVKFGWRTVLYNLPLYACDLNIFILPLAIFKKHKKNILNKFVLYFVTTGPIFTLLIPGITSGIYAFYSNEVLGTFLPHILYVIVAVLYLKFNHIKCNSKKPYKVWLSMMIILIIVHTINLVLIFTGVFLNANYMFTGHAPPIEIAENVVNLLGGKNPIIRAYFLMMIGYTVMTIAFWGFHKFCERKWAN